MKFLAKIIIHLVGVVSSISVGFPQEIDLATYDSKEGGLYFDQAIIYSYSDHTGQSGEIWIYYSTCSKRFLFDQAAWGREDEMIDYVIAQPDGSYLTFGTEAEGPGNGKVVTVDSVYLEPKDQLSDIPPKDEYIEFIALPESNEIIAGLESKAYKVRRLKDSNGLETIHLATVDYDTRLIYAFNQQAQELRLPEILSQVFGLGHDQLVTRIESSYTDSKGQMYWSKLKLETVDPTTYWGPIKDYTLRIRNTQGELQTLPLTDSIELVGDCY
ncbi:hypothetical protein J2X69_001300 [Algoriphagus sp. 4150]|uniref:hypothetical protein n=1 Tax=Algoriphagus sp. 4150 TaxID=2817756 RepID=UPI0028564AA5|nr:hypothetical protein [Algoriphagus sp. 4150]MDR7128965.1 hypothetical protein [Algoriphagus sp. 4150]